MAKGKQRWAIGLLTLALIVIGLAFFVLPRRDIGTDQIVAALRDAVSALPGGSLEVGSVSGNPITGYRVRDITIRGPGGEIARAPVVVLRLLLPSLLRGDPLPKSITVRNGTLSAEKLLAALRARTPSPGKAFSLKNFPVIRFEPVTISTASGDFIMKSARLSPGDGSATVSASGTFLEIPFDIGGSVVDDDALTVTDAFLRAGDTVVALSGALAPLDMKGTMEGLRLERIASAARLNLPLEGSVTSSFSVSAREGQVLLSGEGGLHGGHIAGIDAEGDFHWTANPKTMAVSLHNGRIFSSPAQGSVALAFGGAATRARVTLALEQVALGEWTGLLPWLSTWSGTLSTLKVALEGPMARLGGPVTFEAPALRIGEFPVQAVSGTATLADGASVALAASGQWNGTPLTVRGDIPLGGDAPLTVRLATDRLDIKSAGALYAPGMNLGGTGALDAALTFGTGKSVSAEGTLSAPKIFALGAEARKLKVAFSLADGALSLPSFTLSLPAGGTVTGTGTLSELDKDSGTMTLSGEGKGIRGEAVQALLGKGAKGLALGGAYDLAWKAHGPLREPDVTFSVRGQDAPLSPGLPLRNLAFGGRFGKGRLAVTGGSAALFGGRVEFSGGGSLAKDQAIDVKGRFAGLSVQRIASAQGMNPGEFSGALSGTFSLSGRASDPAVAVTLETNEATVLGVPFAKVRAEAEGTFAALKLTTFSGNVFGAPLVLQGELALAGTASGTLKGTVHGLDIATVRDRFFPSATISGQMNGAFTLTTGAGKPASIVFSADSPILSVYGTLMERVRLSARSTGRHGVHVGLEGSLGRGPIALEGDFVRAEDAVTFTVKNRGTIDLDRAMAGVSSQTTNGVRGGVDLEVRGRLGGGSVQADGTITSESVQIYGITVTNVAVPFTWRGKSVTIANGRGDSHGGKFSVAAEVDPVTMRWNGTLAVRGMDLDKATKGFFGGKGRLSGTADLSVTGSGTGGMVGLIFGNGEFTAKDGALSGFEALDALSKDGTVRFASALSHFSVDGRNIYLMPGSRVTAPVGDKIYRYFSANGSVGFRDTPLDLRCAGDVNIRALNTVLGALQGILSVDGNPLSPEFFQNLLSGLVGGISNNDFRELTFNLKGTWKDPVLSDLLVMNQRKPVSFPRPTSPGRNEQKITVTLEFPVGEGSNTTKSTEDQVKQQILKNILRQIVPSGSSDDSFSPYDY